MIDQHACPAVSISGADGIGSVLMGSPTVWINAQMACRMGDIVVEKPGLALGPMNPIIMGCPTVLIGGPSASISMAGGVMTVTCGGVTITGSPADVAAFVQMLANAAMSTNAGGLAIVNAFRDTAHPITMDVGRSQPNVIVDNFATNQVDLNDLDALPPSPRAAHPNETAQDEMIVHFIEERHSAAASGNPDFGPAHQDGINAQNAMRSERGQPAVTDQVFAGTDPAGNTIGRTNYADGTHQDAHIDSNGDIVSVDPP
jgi:hypothetical protein